MALQAEPLTPPHPRPKNFREGEVAGHRHPSAGTRWVQRVNAPPPGRRRPSPLTAGPRCGLGQSELGRRGNAVTAVGLVSTRINFNSFIHYFGPACLAPSGRWRGSGVLSVTLGRTYKRHVTLGGVNSQTPDSVRAQGSRTALARNGS